MLEESPASRLQIDVEMPISYLLEHSASEATKVINCCIWSPGLALADCCVVGDRSLGQARLPAEESLSQMFPCMLFNVYVVV